MGTDTNGVSSQGYGSGLCLPQPSGATWIENAPVDPPNSGSSTGSRSQPRDGTSGEGGDATGTVKEAVHYTHKAADHLLDKAREAAKEALEHTEEGVHEAKGTVERAAEGALTDPVGATVATAAVGDGQELLGALPASTGVTTGNVLVPFKWQQASYSMKQAVGQTKALSTAAPTPDYTAPQSPYAVNRVSTSVSDGQLLPDRVPQAPLPDEGTGLIRTAGKALGGVAVGLGVLEAGEGVVDGRQTIEDITVNGPSVQDGLKLTSDAGKVVGGTMAAFVGVQKVAPAAAATVGDALPGLAEVAGDAVPVLGAATAIGAIPQMADAVHKGDVQGVVASGLKIAGGSIMTLGLVMDGSVLGLPAGITLNAIGGGLMLASTVVEHGSAIASAVNSGMTQMLARNPQFYAPTEM